METIKMTKGLPSNYKMEKNQFGAATYIGWCNLEAQRIGGGAYVHHYFRTVEGVQQPYCRIDK